MIKRAGLVLLASWLIASGCGRNSAAEQGGQTMEPRASPGQTASWLRGLWSDADRNQTLGLPKANGQIDVDYLKDNLKPGLTQTQVAAQFGGEHTAVIRKESGDLMWRFDYADVGYQFQATGAAVNTNMAQADLDGLRKGMIHQQLFISWEPESLVSGYSELYYLDDRDGKHHVRLYTVQPDGSTADQEVTGI